MSTSKHPKGLYLIFATSTAERFSYYGMRAIFILFLTQALLFDKEHAASIYGSYTGLVYLTPLIGGYIADKYWGIRRSVFWGAIMMAVGQFLLFPGTFSVVKTAWVNTLLGIVMFGMGLTLKPEDFKVVFSRPKDVIIGCIAQFTLMPFLAWALTQLFHLPTELAIGVILVGTCPGGTSSNVMTYLSKGDVALSVGMTAVSTVLAPFLTPLLTLLYAGQRVEVNPVNMFLSIVKVVLVPIALGFVVNHFFHAFTQNAVRVLPLISTTAIVLIICAVVSANSAKIMTSGLLILAVVILHNLLGYLTGFGVGKLLKLDSTKCRAISIEVGMQNSGLATSLAAAHFAQYPLATIPGAVFSVWHNISGALLANFFARTAEKKD